LRRLGRLKPPGTLVEDAREVYSNAVLIRGLEGLDSRSPQTVLKTAGLASTAVHQPPPEFGYYLADSKVVRPLPHLYSKLAVILAGSLAVNRSLRPAENYPIRIRWVAAACRL